MSALIGQESIPRIIHQIWIGPKPAPTKFMDTWKDKHPDFEYIRWTEKEMKKRGFVSNCQNRIDEMEELNGKADIIRWELLYKYGGYFFDADSICIEPIDEVLMKTKCFAGWEQEQVREGLIATGTMGFPPKHPLVKAALEWIQDNCVSVQKTGLRAWITVGPCLLTNMYNTGKYKDMTIFPSYYFLPVHCSGLKYEGHAKIYQYQEWGSTKQNYETMNQLELPLEYTEPTTWVSVLIPSYNTKHVFVVECLDSIKRQKGHFGIEIVWINDGSDKLSTMLLKRELERFQKTTRFVKIVYEENDGNKGLGVSLNRGVLLCSNDIICRMDADDIMSDDRLQTQINFMKNNKECVLCGAQVRMFKTINNVKHVTGITSHEYVTDINKYKVTRQHWLMNHPTFCFRKKEIIEVGNYDDSIHTMCEDFNLILRVLKKYKRIYNIQQVLLDYRLHEDQVTYNGGKLGSAYWTDARNKMIDEILQN